MNEWGILRGNMSALSGNGRGKMSDRGKASHRYFTGKELTLAEKTDLKLDEKFGRPLAEIATGQQPSSVNAEWAITLPSLC